MQEEEYKDEAILLITYENQFELTNEGIEFLSSLKGNKISIVSIVGPHQSGKSSFGNFLIESENGFNTSSKTQGIWIWGHPVTLSDHSLLLIMDCEGLKLTDSSFDYDFSLFSLCILISSIVIYNTNESVDDCLTTFSKLTNRLKDIIVRDEELITSNEIPEIMFTFRLKTQSQQTPSINSKDAMMSILNSNSNNASTELFMSLFTKRKVFDCPSEITDKLTNDSIDKMNFIKSDIRKRIQPKRVENINLNGNFIFGLLQSYADSLNMNDTISIRNSLESVLLSSTLDQAEKILGNDVKLLEKYLQSPKKSNINDLFRFYYDSLINPELEELCTASVGEFLSAKQIFPYITTILTDNIDSYNQNYNGYVIEYEDMIKKCQSNPAIVSLDQLSLKNIKSYFNSFTSYVEDNISPIISYAPFSFSTQMAKLINSNMIEPLSSIGSILEIKINEILGSSSQLAIKLDQAQAEKTKYIKLKQEKILQLNYQVETLDRNLKEKELEYMSNLNIEKEKYQHLKENLTKTINEKDQLIKDLEEQIENAKRDQEEKILNNKESSSNFKSLYSKITNMLVDYKLAVDKLNEPNIFIQNIIIEKSINEFEKKYSNLFNLVHEKAEIQQLTDYFEKKVLKLKEENDKLKQSLANEKAAYEEINNNLNELKKELEEKNSILETKTSIISNHQQSIVFYEGKLKDNEAKYQDCEKKLLQSSILCKTRDDEVEYLLIIFKGLLAKRIDKYDLYKSKLSEQSQNILKEYVSEFNLFKK